MDIETLCRDYYKFVYHFVLKMTGNADIAEDLTQETFVKAIRSWHTYENQGKAGGWLGSIAMNLIRDHARSQAVRRAHTAYSLDDEEVPEFEASDDWQAQAEMGEAIRKTLKRLPQQYQEALMLHVCEGGVKAVMRRYHCDVRAANSRVWRAKEAFRAAYRELEAIA